MTAPADAASIVVTHEDGTVLVMTRARALAFLGGYTAFPGGRLDDEDASLARRTFGDDGLEARLKACALRELYEETGLVLHGHALRAPPHATPVAEAIVPVDPAAIRPFGRWVTPDYAPARFDTRFFRVEVRSADPARPDPREVEALAWETPRQTLARFSAHERLMNPPARAVLEALAPGFDGAEARIAAAPGADGGPHYRFEPVPDIRPLALRTPTLPPATTTNTYLLGHERLAIVDPATYEPSERTVLEAAIEDRRAAGARPVAVVLTHHHRDHVGSAAWLAARAGLPIWAHPVTRDLLRKEITVDGTLDDGDVLDLGRDAAGRPLAFEVLHTPGHAPGHIVLRDLRTASRAFVVGDMVASVGTIIIDPPEGDMAEYIRQLERLAAFGESILFPAHGAPIVEGRAKLEAYIAHRLDREAKVVAALVQRPNAPPDALVPLAYAETPSFLHPLAARSCLAHLEKLVAEGRARRQGDRFSPLG